MEGLLLSRLNSLFDYLAQRVGRAATYKRFKASSYHPTLGEMKEFWEEANTKVILIDPRNRALRLPEDVAGKAQAILAIKRAVFNKQPGEQTDPRPGPGDEILIGNEVWETDLGERYFYTTDSTESIYFIAVRRRE